MATSPLPAGMTGTAVFSEDRTRRHVLTRLWNGATHSDRFALWIGMNPSMAGENENDPTVIRECGFTERLGVSRYAKVNVLDFISTDPKGLLSPGVEPVSNGNYDRVMRWARAADHIVLAYGVLPKPFQAHATVLVRALQGLGKPLLCLGTTAQGHPKHPLYLRSDTPFLPYVARP